MNRQELENRLINFAIETIKLTNEHKNNYAGNHLSNQIIRSATSVPLNYGEAQSAESKKDFVHKLQVVLKELRETMVNLKIIKGAQLSNNIELLDKIMVENDELIAILVKTIQTLKSKINK